MKQDMIVILDLGSTENARVARAVRALGVYSEIYPHDTSLEQLKALPNVKGLILSGGENRVVDGVVRPVYFYSVDVSEFAVNKLRDRGSLSVRTIVTNVQDFAVNLAKGLGLM